jgi:hypothetical protein
VIRDPLRKKDFSCSQIIPDIGSRLTFQEKGVLVNVCYRGLSGHGMGFVITHVAVARSTAENASQGFALFCRLTALGNILVETRGLRSRSSRQGRSSRVSSIQAYTKEEAPVASFVPSSPRDRGSTSAASSYETQ